MPVALTSEKVLIRDSLRDVARINAFEHRDYQHRLERARRSREQALQKVPEEFKQEVRNLVENYTLRATEEAPVQMKIILKDETPITTPYRRLAPKETEEVNKQVDEWLREGIIVPSFSEFSSAVVVVR